MKASATRKKPLHKLGGLAILLGICVAGLMGQIWAAEAGRAKITGIAYVRVKVTDVEKAKAFYGGVLGLESGAAKDGNLVQASFVVNRDQHVELTKGAAGTSGSYLVEIGLATDDLMKMRTYLMAKGVATNEIMAWPDGTKYFETQDPEGNKLVFVEQTKNVGAGSAGAARQENVTRGICGEGFESGEPFLRGHSGVPVVLAWRIQGRRNGLV